MYALEVAGTLLYFSIIVSFSFFVFLLIHSLIEERSQETARQVSPPEPAATQARQPA